MYAFQLFKKSTLSLLALIQVTAVFAQPSEELISRDQYISMWKDVAIDQMISHKIPASITLAQGILESANGNSELAKYANNHFGIKCHEWNGERMYKDDDHKDDCFRKYLSAQESYTDHSNFLTKRGRYSSLFDLEITDYKGWARGLKKAGYATNPKYPTLLINLIEKHKLYEYDQQQMLASGRDSEINPMASNSNLANTAIISNSSVASVNTHSVMTSSNNIKFITAKTGDTFYKIAKEYEMGLWQLYKYNDISSNDILLAGDIIYLQPKKNRSKKSVKHTIIEGQSMKDVSQLYGVKLKKLYKMNELAFGLNPPTGTQLVLK
jgi:LysM repeat protein